MEHRYYPRLEASVKIGIFKRDELLGYFKTRDISLEGLFFKMVPCVLNPNDVIGVLISVNGNAYMQKGIVVHATNTGVGVLLIEADKQVFRAIFSMINMHKVLLSQLVDGSGQEQMSAERQLPMVGAQLDSEPIQAENRQIEPQQAPQNHYHAPAKELMVKIGTRFDITSTSLINQLINTIQSKSPRSVVIDLAKTQHLFDSGLDLLLLLKQEAGDLRDRIYLTNISSKIVGKLSTSSVATNMHIL